MNFLFFLNAVFILINSINALANSAKLEDPFYVSLLPENMEHKIELKCTDEYKKYECISYEEKCEFANEYGQSGESQYLKSESDSNYRYDELYGKFSPPYSETIHSEIIKIEQLKVKGQKEVDVTNYIEMFNYGPRVKNEKRNEFKLLLAKWNPVTVSLKGICKKEELKQVKHEINVFTQPISNSSSVGKIVLAIEKGSLKGSFINSKMMSVPFEPNLVNTFCEPDHKNIFYHQVFEHRNGWSNLGKGPWGQNGWIQIEAEPILGSNIYFQNDKLGPGRSTYNKDKTTYSKFSGGESEAEVIKLEDIVYPDGKLRGKVDCEPGC